MHYALLLPPAFLGIPLLWGYSISWTILCLGRAGWLSALILRSPLAAMLRYLNPQRILSATTGIAISGPAEEGMRLLCLLLIGRDFIDLYTFAIGWAGFEILFHAFNAFTAQFILWRGGKAAEELKQHLDPDAESANPLWAFVERFSATVFHLGLTLILAASPWFILLTATLHSYVNIRAVAMMKAGNSLLNIQVFIFVLAGMSLVAGLILIKIF